MTSWTRVLTVLQDEKELQTYIALCKELKVKKYLEIGSYLGGTLALVSVHCQTDLSVSIDLGYGPLSTIEELNNTGRKAIFIPGNSQDPEVIQKAKDLGPYDLIFIDGDHTYEGVKSDYENYSGMAPVVAIHDVYDYKNTGYGVRRYWDEIRWSDQTFRQIMEFRTPHSSMGYGVIFK